MRIGIRRITNKTLAALCRQPIVPAILVLILSGLASAQPGAANARGFTPGGGYALSDFENVSMTNGNVMLSFPLAQLPVGRTGLSTGIYLTYNSKLYDTKTEYFQNYQQQCDAQIEWGIIYNIQAYQNVFLTCGYYTKELLTASEEGGWRYSAGYFIKTEDRSLEYGALPTVHQPSCTGGDGLQLWKHRYKVHVIFPDGSKHEMVPSGYTESPLSDRYFNVNMDGNLVLGCGYYQTVSRPVYYSVDGTYLRMEFNSSANRWFLYFPDGSYYDFGGSGSYPRLYDRDGAYAEIRGSQIVDQQGRSIRWGHDSQTNEDTFTTDGFGGADVVKRVKWKTIYVTKNYKPYSEQVLNNCATSRSCPPTQNPESVDKAFQVVDYLKLPSQVGDLKYTFSYNGYSTLPNPITESVGLGELSGVELPSGAEISYGYNLDNQTTSTTTLFTKDVLQSYLTTKTITYDQEYDGSASPVTETWLYGNPFGSTGGSTGGSVTAPDGSTTSEMTWPVGWRAGLSLQSIAPDGTKVERLYAQNGPASAPITTYATNPYVKTEFTSIKSGSSYTLTAAKDFAYDKNGNVTEIKEYDWMPYGDVPRSGSTEGELPTGLPTNASNYLKRITKTEFYNATPEASSTTYNDPDSYHAATSPRLLRLPAATEVQDASQSPKARSEMVYDYTSYSTNTLGGNLTTTKTWDSTKGSYSNPLTSSNWITTSATYDSTFGFPLTTTDANGVVTTLTYGCIDGSTSCASELQNLYPTKTEVASNYSSLKRTSSAKYDFHTGVATEVKDVDNDVRTVTEYDDLGRPVKVRSAYGTALESWVQTIYDDEERRIIVKSDLETLGDGKKVAIQHFDQLGRVRLARTLENAATEDPTNEQHGIKVQTRYKFASGYTYQLTSNPYRAATSAAETDATMGWTLSTAWSSGIRSEVQTFAGAGLPSAFGGSNTTSTGIVRTDIDADRTLVTDQAGKSRISKTNALGQLKEVWEILGASETGSESVSFPGTSIAHGFKTAYSYDTLNNLILVDQGNQEREFVYSSLSRMTSETSPEAGTTTYEFDNNGNVTERTDSRGVSANLTYDALNRVTQKSYSGESGYTTPTINFTYDEFSHAKGKLTKVSSSISETRYLSFDDAGRMTSSRQTTDGNDYDFQYSYNLAGMLVEETYPSGRKVKNVLDSSGDLSIVQSKKNANYGYFDYAKSFSYAPTGAVTRMQLGNGQWQNTAHNSRMQATQIAQGITSGATDLLKLDLDYGLSQNNGNLIGQTITVPTVGTNNGFTAVQSYSYDSLNRISSATETVSSSQTWKQTFTFDRFGNRNFDEANTTTLPKLCNGNTEVCSADRKKLNPSVNTATNRLNTSDDYAYSSNGNMTADAYGRVFKYDADNKQYEVRDSQNQIVGQYYFDGNGKRIKKVVPSTGETTIFVYDSSGKLAAEYSTDLSTTQQVSYVTPDHLGSPRIKTNENGAVIARNDYHPYGEEISTSQRTQALGYKPDDVRQRFTTYQRDYESQFDYAEARMYSNSTGRFTACDPITNSKDHPISPQRWNLYVYVINKPLNTTDPDGKKPKREIDVFLTYEQADTKRWKAIQKYAAKHGAKINIYTFDSGTATAEQFKKSIETKGRTVILIGHSEVPRSALQAVENGTGTAAGQGVGLMFAGGGLASPTAKGKGYMVGAATLEGVEAQARNIVILSCDFGDTFAPLGSSKNTNLLWAAGGNDGQTTTVDTVVKVGKKMAEIFARGGTPNQAKGAGNAILERASDYDGDTIVREKLQPLMKPEE